MCKEGKTMQVNEELVKKVIEEVLQEVLGEHTVRSTKPSRALVSS